MRLAAALLGLPLLAAPSAFTVKDAIQAEWKRQPPVFTEAEKAALPATDRARLELTLQRIGAPGAPALLPPELEKPTLEVWEAKAKAAKTMMERFNALHFLNRLRSPKALTALEGLTPEDAAFWPRQLHLEGLIAAARLNGAEVSAELQRFLEALQAQGKIDPVRAQAARLRLVLAGKEKELLPAVKATPGAVLLLLDACNRGPWERRERIAKAIVDRSYQAVWSALGVQPLDWKAPACAQLEEAMLQRVWDGLPEKAPEWLEGALAWGLAPHKYKLPTQIATAAEATKKLPAAASAQLLKDARPTFEGQWGLAFDAAALPALLKADPQEAAVLRGTLLTGPDPLARAAAIDAFEQAPADLDALVKTLWKSEEYDGVQVLLQSLEKWKLPEEQRKALLKHFYEHPCWTARLDACTQLRMLDPSAPWPTAPAPTEPEQALLAEATRLATAAKPVRVRLTFSGARKVVLKLDPVNAPMNVANFLRLARKGFFTGRRVPRVVPDFVVQMGSPVDTMDGGPGYTVRCENSLVWYGPGTVGMALSGKDTGGSQFFITTNATPHLTGRYTRLGEVESLDRAMRILDDLELGAKIVRVEVL